MPPNGADWNVNLRAVPCQHSQYSLLQVGVVCYGGLNVRCVYLVIFSICPSLGEQQGSQNKLITRLMRADTLRDVLSSVFAIPTTHTWVYMQMQCQSLNKSMRTFLTSSTAVVKFHGKAVLEQIPFDEQARILGMRDGRTIQPHDWVIITKGIYQQDLGCVLASHDWGLDVLVIPCLFPPHTRAHRKRSETIQELFVAGCAAPCFGTSQQIHSITKPTPHSKPEADQGLLVLECEHHGVVRTTTAPVKVLALFHQSNHPTVLKAEIQAPCPTEWQFDFGERVMITGGPMRY